MTNEHAEMLIKIDEILNELRNAFRNHICENEDCCVKSLLAEIEFNE